MDKIISSALDMMWKKWPEMRLLNIKIPGQ